jgi:hypothetical protein
LSLRGHFGTVFPHIRLLSRPSFNLIFAACSVNH